MSARTTRGISKKEAAERNYFDILTRHFWHLCGASFWFGLTNLLFFGGALYLFSAYLGGDNLVILAQSFLRGEPILLPFVPFLPLMLTGPFTAGFTYVIRNYAKQEHTFLIADFFFHAKRNWKQAFLTSVITTLVTYLALQAFLFYHSFFITNGLPLGVFYTLFTVASVLLIITSFYIYPIMVTFRMSYKVVLKNAWTFAVLKLPQNLIIFAILFSVNFGIFYLFFVVFPLIEAWFFLMFFFLTGFTAFSANYYIWHVLDKYIVQLVTKQAEKDRIFVDEEHMENPYEFEEDYDEQDF